MIPQKIALRRARRAERKLYEQLTNLLDGHCAWHEAYETPGEIAYLLESREVCRQCWLLLREAQPRLQRLPSDKRAVLSSWHSLSEMQFAVQRGIWPDVCNPMQKMVHFRQITQRETLNAVVLLLGRTFSKENDDYEMVQEKDQT